ncbi:Protein N-acetyltransferase, RimJ/RimL family [Soonwooa buanensis]|uniref:Protein N-acetyltransferase, RimJ/RimL family n=1 Tax=Soonwooa buanensis TaxID=619805 RepID=A0A1T5GI27_9FLAO|nr:GNAT family N-acetyltransferase [Soonwooa buanensis]SKC07977.1 Protein N-acetyltransferase, RimJ/RimL family [Soonwooa buanensis]
MEFSLQPRLENDFLILEPLQKEDFEALYKVASEKEVWAQHPNPDRYKREVFQNFFEGAIQSGGAFKIYDKNSGELAGSSRFYDYNDADNSILIGYTFYGTNFWGTGLNHKAKRIMMDYIFQYVDKVIFHIGAENLRSQISISRLGAEKFDEQLVEYFGESPKLNFIYQIKKENYLK